MKLKFGAIVTDGRGKIGGHVLSKNRGGSYLRTKVTPVNPDSPAQAGVRARFTSMSQGWRGLTDAQRAAWNASVGLFAKTDIFGDKKNPSGFNLYVALNSSLALVGQAAISTPPAVVSVLTTNIVSLVCAKGTPNISLTMSAVVPAGTSMIIKSTPGLSAGVNFVKSQFRQISVVAPAGTVIQSLVTAWTTKFGAMANAGSKIYMQVYFINNTTGVQSGRQLISAIVAA